MPTTSALVLPSARNDSRFGILIENFSSDPSRLPTVKIEKGAGDSVS
jgi:hypothetical protein